MKCTHLHNIVCNIEFTILFFSRFDKVPLVTPNGDVLLQEMSFEVNSNSLFIKIFFSVSFCLIHALVKDINRNVFCSICIQYLKKCLLETASIGNCIALSKIYIFRPNKRFQLFFPILGEIR